LQTYFRVVGQKQSQEKPLDTQSSIVPPEPVKPPGQIQGTKAGTIYKYTDESGMIVMVDDLDSHSLIC
jgi:hypothetical protein